MRLRRAPRRRNPGVHPATVVASHVDHRLNMARDATATDPWRPQSLTTCVIYFIKSERTGDIKIGRTTNLTARIKQLHTASSDVLRVLGVFAGQPQDERFFHEAFKDLRLNGEWFKPHPDLFDFIKRYTKPEKKEAA